MSRTICFPRSSSTHDTPRGGSRQTAGAGRGPETDCAELDRLLSDLLDFIETELSLNDEDIETPTGALTVPVASCIVPDREEATRVCRAGEEDVPAREGGLR
jgi:hypothetical protein